MLFALLLSGPFAAADSVELINGDVLHGKVVEQSDQAVTIEHPVLGRVSLTPDRVKAVVMTPAGAQAEEVTDTAKSSDKPKTSTESKTKSKSEADLRAEKNIPDFAPFYDYLLPGWDRRLEFGITGEEGNNPEFNLRLAFNAKKVSDRHRWNIKTVYYNESDDRKRNKNEFAGSTTLDWLRPESPWFTFAKGSYEYDEFESWEHRPGGYAGIGKQIKDTPRNNVIGRAALGGSYEFGTVDEFFPEGFFELTWEHQINPRQKLESYIDIFPKLDDFGESRINFGTAWIISIDRVDGLSLKLGFDDEYDSKTDDDASHNDFKYFMSVVYDF